MSGAIVKASASEASLEFDGAVHSSTDLRAEIVRYTALCAQLGLGPGSRVVIHRRLTDQYVISLIALVEMGCCVVPLAPATAPRMVDEITALVDANAIVSEASPTPQIRRLRKDDAPATGHSRDAEAYILFTSGSSGTPKGVLGPRSGLRRRLGWGHDTYFSEDIQRCAIGIDPAFIDSLITIMGAYRAGKQLIIPPLPVQRDLGRLADFIQSERIEQITLTPSTVVALKTVDPARFRSVRRWIFSGEVLRRSWAAWIRAITPDADIINSYGSTEVCGDVTAFTLVPGAAIPDRIPIGEPAPGVQTSVVPVDDADDHTTGSPRIGELWVGGDQVALGYLGATPETEHRFHTAVDGTRWLRTGDIVQEADGMLQFLGRTDDVHKVRGRRVDTSAVAAIVESVVGVRAAHAWVHRTDDGASALHTEVILEPDAAVGPEAITAALRDRTLSHLVPDRIVVVPSFDRGQSGKVRPRVRASSPRSQRPPETRFATGNAHVIASLLSDVTEEPDIWPTTDVTKVGLDSLRAVILAEQISRYLGCRVTALDIIEAKTVQRLADSIPTVQSTAPRAGTREVSTGAGGPVLLLLHPAIGTCLGYFPLLQCISYPGPVVFVEQDDQARAILSTGGMEALAEHYARQASEIRPGSEFDVVGYSFGALIAPSVSRALASLGCQARSTVLLDPTVATSTTRPSTDWALRRILGDGGHRYRIPDSKLDLGTAMEVIRRGDGPLHGVPSAQLKRWADSLRFNMRASAGFEPLAPPTRTLIVRATGTVQPTDSSALWTRPARAGIHIESLDCGHFDLLSADQAPRLARIITRFLTNRGRDAAVHAEQ
ncbi:AMP-binding protein [Prescottella agglutinans]|uniref:Acyl-coenzyme A synthetase/AMP-(Fatty) acid ligase/thioesterase domain-containing protein/aryl carrier-like protein n=1 Tax=Prescottella agglutinans TaxID=1644129 RepID=A0ABT6MKR8_9NOCA|nr:AMP-binding protein [Prescottella agglutinans]MDH6284921.1 acyl-coenzyme A synthetase/AMP-(fatty) acid ligase/thioesterase domain-containing protein/aryl carrier-like protein [Prescottella agglutinans]